MSTSAVFRMYAIVPVALTLLFDSLHFLPRDLSSQQQHLLALESTAVPRAKESMRMVLEGFLPPSDRHYDPKVYIRYEVIVEKALPWLSWRWRVTDHPRRSPCIRILPVLYIALYTRNTSGWQQKSGTRSSWRLSIPSLPRL